MAELHIRREHRLGLAKARKTAWQWAELAEEKFGLACTVIEGESSDVVEFSRTGFTGGINWYRNLDRNWEITPQLDGAKVTMPSLFIGGSLDPVLAMSPPSLQDAVVTDHRGTVIVEGAGHWVQQESPTEVNHALLGFLSGLDLARR